VQRQSGETSRALPIHPIEREAGLGHPEDRRSVTRMESTDGIPNASWRGPIIQEERIVAGPTDEEVATGGPSKTLFPLTAPTFSASSPLPVLIKTFGTSALTLMLSDVTRMISLVKPATGPEYGTPAD
jgi:hypothetical protein